MACACLYVSHLVLNIQTGLESDEILNRLSNLFPAGEFTNERSSVRILKLGAKTSGRCETAIVINAPPW